MVPNFSMVLISRNEEKTLPRMLKSIKPFLQEGGDVVIMDTGSTDNTVAIAKEAGCHVIEVGDRFHYTITDEIATLINEKFIVDGEDEVVKEGDRLFNFSAARNYAATFAANDMISCQDCDEEYTTLDINTIHHLIGKGHKQFEYNFVFSHDEYGKEAIKFIQSKFYDRTKLQWVGIIHEVLQQITSEPVERCFLPEDIFKLEHWQNHETNRTGYLKGLALDCFSNPNNDRNSHYFARELMYQGRLHSAIKEFKRHIAMDRWPAEKAQSMIYVGDCYGQLNIPMKQVEWYQKAFELDSSRRESLIKLAYFYKHNNSPQKVACYVAAAMEIPWIGFYSNQRSHYENTPHELMYWAKGWLGDIEGAKYHIKKALEYQPKNPQYVRDTIYYFEYPDNGLEGDTTFEDLQSLYLTAKSVGTIAAIGASERNLHALRQGCRHGHVTTEISEMVDMIFVEDYSNFESLVNKYSCIICGTNFEDHKDVINSYLNKVYKINNIWYKDLLPLFGEYPNTSKSIDLRDRIKEPYNLKVLNIGVGDGTSGLGMQLPYFTFKELRNIDIHEPYLTHAKTGMWNTKKVFFELNDIRNMYTIDKLNYYDLALIFDVLEHLPKKDGIELLKLILESSCDLLMFVPSEDDKYVNRTGIASMDHLSTWKPEELREMGFDVEVIENFNYGTFSATAMWVTKRNNE